MSSRLPMIALAIGSMKLSKYTRRFRFTAMLVSPVMAGRAASLAAQLPDALAETARPDAVFSA